MATTLEEGRFLFTFDDNAVKFDNEFGYYGKYFKNLPGGKGVDFIAFSPGRVQMIEIKDCFGDEARNQWRIGKDNSSRAKRAPGQDETDRDSVDIEVAKKVASTIACLYGAWTKASRSDSAEELAELWKAVTDSQLPADGKQLQVILFLEGDFGCRTRPKSAIMTGLEESIRKKLSWLNCKVSVIDSEQCRRHNSGFAVAAT